MKLNARFGIDVLALLAGGFLAVTAVALPLEAAGWVAFGVFTGLAVLGALGAVLAGRLSARIGHGVLGLVGLWSLIAALVFTSPALLFADALAVVLVALVDLTVHELSTERVVHQLEVREPAPVA
ncbi:hypothetical protein FPZ12_043000 [Amycolatopsis acidicola]|uniref:DUF4233 domain-containing protein n=1 Tax=Amycolatopsis acidicola TaxID=2596893 RepID=A0A5N0ULR8_9PSEU|nr:hypothetical protein [Amycolatopsis acidicola]KAA9149561.1 hypothetical protein FPZ12_043000 [Amycolatopsis acidicola]